MTRFRSLVVSIDLTPISDRVLGRVALLPLADDAQVTLLHVVPKGLAPLDQRSAERDANRVLADEARLLRKSLPKNVVVEPVVKIGVAARAITAYAKAKRAELIVMGRGGGRALRDVFLGSTAERVLRRGQLPVLVIRLPPRAAYSRPVLALDLDQAAHEILRMMLRVIPSPRPSIAIIHAFDMPYHGFVYSSIPEHKAEAQKIELERKASRGLARLLATGLKRAGVPPEDVPRWRTQVRYGPPRSIIERAVKKEEADLLVLGTHGYSGIAYMLLGTVAGDVLREVACDVLVVPPVVKSRGAE